MDHAASPGAVGDRSAPAHSGRARFPRLRALVWFFVALLYTFTVSQATERFGAPLNAHLSPVLADTARVCISLALLLAGYTLMGLAGQGQRSPVRDMGLNVRPGALREWALGAALGWAGIVVCVLLIAVFGEIVLELTNTPAAWLTLGETLIFLLLATLGEELAFRGYPFQRLLDATNPFTATVALSALYASAHLGNPGATSAAFCSTFLSGILLSLAYLRTRALWVGWGLHFAWNAATAVLFGLPLSGLTGYSPVVSSYTRGPVWLTGGGYGPEGSAIVIPVLLVLLIALAKATVELKHRWATPVIVPGGYPVDIDALSRAQHERAMGAAAAPPPAQGLVQISPSSPPAPPDTR